MVDRGLSAPGAVCTMRADGAIDLIFVRMSDWSGVSPTLTQCQCHDVFSAENRKKVSTVVATRFD